jgi:hypothetical protein
MKLTGAARPLRVPALRFFCGTGTEWRAARPIVHFRPLLFLLPLLLTACVHKTNQAQVQSVAPPISNVPKPNPEPVVLSPAANAIPAPALPEMKPAAQPPKPVKRSRPVSGATQQASNGSNGVSAIGQLSSGEPYDLRSRTSDSIAATERGLNGLHRKLSDQEQNTAAQIREFLKQARRALASGDVDGANTLAAKAKVLLGELIQ